MSIQTFSDLQSAIGSYFYGRTDLQAQTSLFTQLFEAKANRLLRCRQMETLQTTTLDITQTNPQYVSLPSNYHTMRRVRIANGTPGQKPTLKYATPQQIDDWEDEDDTPDQPVFYTIFGSTLQLYPAPDQDYVINMVFRQYLTPLDSVDNTTNWLLQTAPDLYLFGSLEQAEPFLMNDERVPLWQSRTMTGVQDLNTLSVEATTGSGPLVIRRNRKGY